MLPNTFWRHLGSAKRELEPHKGCLGEPNRSTEAAWRCLWAPWALPGKTPGPAWDTKSDHFGTNFDPKFDYFAANLFEAVFLKFFSSLLCFSVFPNLKDTL